jgi:hypothetical protein
MADVVDHPLRDEELGQLGQAPRRKRQIVLPRAGQGDLLDRLTLRQRERRRATTGILRIQRLEPDHEQWPKAVAVATTDGKHLTDAESDDQLESDKNGEKTHHDRSGQGRARRETKDRNSR